MPILTEEREGAGGGSGEEGKREEVSSFLQPPRRTSYASRASPASGVNTPTVSRDEAYWITPKRLISP
jgi:hypothetical protein